MQRKYWIVTTVILLDILTGMEFDIAIPSFPEIQLQFHLSNFWVESLLTINFIAYCISMFTVGPMSDTYGTRNTIICGLLIFITGSLLCLYPDFYLMSIGRFIQGLGIAAPSILSFVVISDLFEIKKQQFYMGILNGLMNLSVGLAPVIGSHVNLYYHWRGNFKLLFGLGLICLLLSLLFLPKQTKALEQASNPPTYWSLLTTPPLNRLIWHITWMFIPYWVFVGMLPLLFIGSFKVPLAEYGFYQGAIAFSFAIGSILLGFIIEKINQRKWLKGAALLYAISFIFILITAFSNTQNPLWIIMAFIPFVYGQLVPSVTLYPICLNYQSNAKGHVSGLLQANRLIICTVVLQATSLIYRGRFLEIGLVLCGFILLIILTFINIIRNAETFKIPA
jgi:DHA1 family bicyclomycin/chloramphenicol resistance-like MFS transporter